METAKNGKNAASKQQKDLNPICHKTSTPQHLNNSTTQHP
jgi:hypothetical protein